MLAGAAYLAVAMLIDLSLWNAGRAVSSSRSSDCLLRLDFIPTQWGVKAAATFGAALGYVLVDENVAGSPYVPHADLPGFWFGFFWLPTVLGSATVRIVRGVRTRRQAALPRQP